MILLCDTGNSTPCFVITNMGKESEKEYVCVCVSLVAKLVKNLPAMQENWVQSLGWEDPLEKAKAIYSSILAEKIPRLYTLCGHKELDATEKLSLTHVFVYVYKYVTEFLCCTLRISKTL